MIQPSNEIWKRDRIVTWFFDVFSVSCSALRRQQNQLSDCFLGKVDPKYHILNMPWPQEFWLGHSMQKLVHFLKSSEMHSLKWFHWNESGFWELTTVSSIYLGESVPEIRPTSNKMNTTVESSTTDFDYNHKYGINVDFTWIH